LIRRREATRSGLFMMESGGGGGRRRGAAAGSGRPERIGDRLDWGERLCLDFREVGCVPQMNGPDRSYEQSTDEILPPRFFNPPHVNL
jgi:hypothetical protein